MPDSKPEAVSATARIDALIDAQIASLQDWRGPMLASLRRWHKAADPEVIEEWKWRGVPVWSHNGIICTVETYKSVVKLTFARGASLPDPAKLFNASLDGHVRRAIDILETDVLNPMAFKALVAAAVALNKLSSREKVAKPVQ